MSLLGSTVASASWSARRNDLRDALTFASAHVTLESVMSANR